MLAADDQGGGLELVTYQKCPFTVVKVLLTFVSKPYYLSVLLSAFIDRSHLILPFLRVRLFSKDSSLVRAFDNGT